MVKQSSKKRRGSSKPGSQNEKNRNGRSARKPRLQTAPKLQRTTFSTSREMDFFSEKELVTQTGHGIQEWPFVIVKELVDNALDACEEADIPPSIEVLADACGITITDNGPGLPESTLAGAADFTVRTSNREAYVAPDRGAQGNALKTLLPMPGVVDPDNGRMIVTAHGKRHVFTCGIDPVSQRAVVHDDIENVKTVSSGRRKKASFVGTSIRQEWAPNADSDGDVLWPFDELLPVRNLQFTNRLRMLVEGFAVFNPHATITLDWFGTRTVWKATDAAWQKWKPDQPTSCHWYEVRHLERLIGAYITHDQDAGTERLVSDLIAEFDGMSGSKKRSDVLDETDLRRVKLSEFVVNGRLDGTRIESLLVAMQKATRPVKPKRLGLIGEDHLRERLLGMGVQPESFRYTKKLAKDGLPWVLESAFGWLGDDAPDNRKIYSGANWSAAINNPFRSFGATGEGLETTLADLRATSHEPIVFVLHLAHPRVEYTDRGKSALVIGGAA